MSLLQGLFSSVLESAGISLFVIVVLPESTAYIGVLLMNGVFIVHILSQILRFFQDGILENKAVFFKYLLAFCFALGGLIFTGIFEFAPGTEWKNKIWTIPLALVSLSIAWSPFMQKAQLYPREKDINSKKRKLTKFSEVAERVDRARRWIQSQQNSTASTMTQSASEASYSGVDSDYGSADPGSRTRASSNQDADEVSSSQAKVFFRNINKFIQVYPEHSARWKNSIISSSVKIILIPAFAFLYGHLLDVIIISDIPAGFNNISTNHPAFPMFLTTLLSSFAGYLFGWLACTLCMQKVSFAIPLTLATPLAFGILLAKASCDISITGLDWSVNCGIQERNLELALPAAICLYISQLLSTGFFVLHSHAIVMQKESQV